ncbi:hypothetical protein RhiLY_10474 [Ceratobasidium sp. AG-Ba]|nr:hypothetical protein RhiLY_10474 [Ceratobasidium sp. AG-Ba]
MTEPEEIFLSHLKFWGLRLPQDSDNDRDPQAVDVKASFIPSQISVDQSDSSTPKVGLKPFERLAAEKPGEELAPDAAIWQLYVEEAREHDRELVDGKNRNLDVMLVFAALFSAILTAFIIESKGLLQQDPADVTVSLLLAIAQSQQRIEQGTPETLPPIEIPSFSAPLSARWVNGLWFTALALSLAAALVSMLAKEWLDAFVGSRPRAPYVYALLHHTRLKGLIHWRALHVIDLLPAMMHLSLLLFSLGLVVYLWTLDSGTAITMVIITVITLLFYLGTTLLGAIRKRCPFVTQISRYLRAALSVLVHSPTFFSKRLSCKEEQPTGDTSDKELRTLLWLAKNARDPAVRDCAYQALAGLRFVQAAKKEPTDPIISTTTPLDVLAVKSDEPHVVEVPKPGKSRGPTLEQIPSFPETRYKLLTSLYDNICERLTEARLKQPREIAVCRGMNVARYASALPGLVHSLAAYARLSTKPVNAEGLSVSIRGLNQLADIAFKALECIWANNFPEFQPDSYAILIGADLRVIEVVDSTMHIKHGAIPPDPPMELGNHPIETSSTDDSLKTDGKSSGAAIIDLEPLETPPAAPDDMRLFELRARYSRMLSRASLCLAYHNDGYAPIGSHALVYLLDAFYQVARCKRLNPDSHLSTHQPQSKDKNQIPRFNIIALGTGVWRYLDALEIGDQDHLIAGLVRILGHYDIESAPRLEHVAGKALSVFGPMLLRQWLATVTKGEKKPGEEALKDVNMVLDRWPKTLESDNIDNLQDNSIAQLLAIATVSVVLADNSLMLDLPSVALSALYRRANMASGRYPISRVAFEYSDFVNRLIKFAHLNFHHIKKDSVGLLFRIFAIKCCPGSNLLRCRGLPPAVLPDLLWLLSQQPGQPAEIQKTLTDICDLLEDDLSIHSCQTYLSMFMQEKKGFDSLVQLFEHQELVASAREFALKITHTMAKLCSICRTCSEMNSTIVPRFLEFVQVVLNDSLGKTEFLAQIAPFLHDIANVLQALQTEGLIMASTQPVAKDIYRYTVDKWANHEEFAEIVDAWEAVVAWADPEVQLFGGLAQLFA